MILLISIQLGGWKLDMNLHTRGGVFVTMLSEATRHKQLSYITRASLSTERHCNDKNN